MLYVFTGSDRVAVRRAAFDFVAREEAEGAVVRTLSSEQYEQGALQSISQSASLFGGHECIVLDSLGEEDTAREELIEHAELLARSPHVVVVIESALTLSEARELKSYAEEWHESKGAERERFNAFALADALVKKDKKSLWLLLMRAREAGLSAEEIIGTLSWQLKAVRLARVTATAKEAGMKDFPYDKAKRGARSFSHDELEELSHSLIMLYHEGHLGSDIDLALEKWVLTV